MARLDCEKIKDLLLDYDEGFLEEDNCQEIAAHLESCKDCADYYRELKDSWQTLAKVELPEIEPTPNYQERFWRRQYHWLLWVKPMAPWQDYALKRTIQVMLGISWVKA